VTTCYIVSGGFTSGPKGLSTSPQFCSSPPLPSFGATHDFFAKITQISKFFAFSSCKKWASLRLPLNVKKPTVLPAPLIPRPEVLPPDLRYRLALPRSPWSRAPQMLRSITATVRGHWHPFRKLSSCTEERNHLFFSSERRGNVLLVLSVTLYSCACTWAR